METTINESIVYHFENSGRSTEILLRYNTELNKSLNKDIAKNTKLEIKEFFNWYEKKYYLPSI